MTVSWKHILSHLHFANCNAEGHMTTSGEIMIRHYGWIEKETDFFFFPWPRPILPARVFLSQAVNVASGEQTFSPCRTTRSQTD